MHPPSDDLDAALPRKIPRGQRRYRYRPDPASSLPRRVLARAKGDPLFLRSVVQVAFVLLCVWIGIEFWLFVRWGMSGGAAGFPARPPGAEAFLPVSGLLGLVHWAYGGELNRIHPAATVILIAIIVMSIVVRKAFCSWVCPIGTLSEWLGQLGRRLFQRNFVLWKWLDYPLRSLKYLLLAYFVSMLVAMSAAALGLFVDGAYNRMADVHMYRFFVNITPVALLTIFGLVVASVLISRFWCRYLCPYGALLGLAGLLSPLRVTRVKSSCIDCELCARACPAGISVHRIGVRGKDSATGQVWSDECTTCLRCVDACPVQHTLEVRAPRRSRAVAAPVIALLVAGLFAVITGIGMATGYWGNSITRAEYLQHFRQSAQPAVGIQAPARR